MIGRDSRIVKCPECENTAVLIHSRMRGFHVCCNTGPTRHRKECKLYIGYEKNGEVLWFKSEKAAIDFWNKKAVKVACG